MRKQRRFNEQNKNNETDIHLRKRRDKRKALCETEDEVRII